MRKQEKRIGYILKDFETEMEILEIKHNNTRLAIYIGRKWDDGLHFFSEDNDFQQVGVWCYNKGKRLLPHKHIKAERKIDRTQEVIFVRNGKVRVEIFGLDGKLVENHILEKNDTMIFLAGGHGYEILENNTQVLEVKNGPYLGSEKDRVRI